MLDPSEVKKLRESLLDHLEAALAITDKINDSVAGFLIERALDQARADTWPGNLDLPPLR